MALRAYRTFPSFLVCYITQYLKNLMQCFFSSQNKNLDFLIIVDSSICNHLIEVVSRSVVSGCLFLPSMAAAALVAKEETANPAPSSDEQVIMGSVLGSRGGRVFSAPTNTSHSTCISGYNLTVASSSVFGLHRHSIPIRLLQLIRLLQC